MLELCGLKGHRVGGARDLADARELHRERGRRDVGRRAGADGRGARRAPRAVRRRARARGGRSSAPLGARPRAICARLVRSAGRNAVARDESGPTRCAHPALGVRRDPGGTGVPLGHVGGGRSRGGRRAARRGETVRVAEGAIRRGARARERARSAVVSVPALAPGRSPRACAGSPPRPLLRRRPRCSRSPAVLGSRRERRSSRSSRSPSRAPRRGRRRRARALAPRGRSLLAVDLDASSADVEAIPTVAAADARPRLPAHARRRVVPSGPSPCSAGRRLLARVCARPRDRRRSTAARDRRCHASGSARASTIRVGEPLAGDPAAAVRAVAPLAGRTLPVRVASVGPRRRTS